MPRHSPYALLSFNFFLQLQVLPLSASGLGSLNCLSFFLQIFGFIVCFEKTSFFFPVTFPPFGLIVILFTLFGKTYFLNYYFKNSPLICSFYSNILYSVFNDLLSTYFRKSGGLKWTRTTDLALIRRAL